MSNLDDESHGIDSTGLTDDIFSKRLPDDCVEYIIFILEDDLQTELQLREGLHKIQTASQALTKRLLQGYIWQRDVFELKLERRNATSSSNLPSWLLRGSTNFGDSIADEWLIVYLLRELGAQFPNAWAHLSDADGEFLLVEAANALPKWLNPEIADNRVWLNQGQLKVIPLPGDSKGGQSLNLTIDQALEYLRDSPQALVHSQSIEDEAFFRLRNYPEEIKSSLHHAMLKIPRRLAHLLHQNLSYISPAVEAFYLRDPVALKPLSTKDTGTLLLPPEDFVTVSTTFNRVGYAQIHSQEFTLPASWTAVTPYLKDARVSNGMKLTCGFEMLLRDPANQDKRAVREMKLLLADLDAGDDETPDDATIATWPQTEDDDKWLDISFDDLETELKGKEGGRRPKGDFGDKAAQENLQKMVSRFESFLADDKAGVHGADPDDDDDEDSDEDSASEPDSEGEDKNASFDDKEFELAMREMMGMPPEEKEAAGLVEEARRLALEMEDSDEGERDEEEETRKVMEMMASMERELKGHGALDLKDLQARAETPGQAQLMRGKGKKVEDVRLTRGNDSEDDGEDLGELSSDDDNEDNDVDLQLLRNVLESFKGQAGMAGPAGNMMAAMGVQMPRDDGDDPGKGKRKGRKK